MRRVIITSGGTREKIDDFRLITNVSSGKLGSMFAEYFEHMGWLVDFVFTKHSIYPKIAETNWWDDHAFDYMNYPKDTFGGFEVESANEAMEQLKELIPRADAVIHAMAVADFGFKKDSDLKLKSDDPDALVEYIKSKIIVNPKIISNFRQWNTNPNFFIVGFKFEINKTFNELYEIAHNSLIRNDCNLVVANDKAEMQKAKKHIGHIISKYGDSILCKGKEEIVKRVYDIVDKAVEDHDD